VLFPPDGVWIREVCGDIGVVELCIWAEWGSGGCFGGGEVSGVELSHGGAMHEAAVAKCAFQWGQWSYQHSVGLMWG